jgi:hypothetical protein
MSVAEILIEKVRVLTPEKQREVLEYIERISTSPTRTAPRVDPEGALADQPSALEFRDFEQARRELWADTPPEGI